MLETRRNTLIFSGLILIAQEEARSTDSTIERVPVTFPVIEKELTVHLPNSL